MIRLLLRDWLRVSNDIMTSLGRDVSIGHEAVALINYPA